MEILEMISALSPHRMHRKTEKKMREMRGDRARRDPEDHDFGARRAFVSSLVCRVREVVLRRNPSIIPSFLLDMHLSNYQPPVRRVS